VGARDGWQRPTDDRGARRQRARRARGSGGTSVDAAVEGDDRELLVDDHGARVASHIRGHHDHHDHHDAARVASHIHDHHDHHDAAADDVATGDNTPDAAFDDEPSSVGRAPSGRSRLFGVVEDTVVT
jgi:hypothetical protein